MLNEANFLGFMADIVIKGGIRYKAIYDEGNDEEITVRGTVIAASESFLLGRLPFSEGDEIEVRNKLFRVTKVIYNDAINKYLLESKESASSRGTNIYD